MAVKEDEETNAYAYLSSRPALQLVLLLLLAFPARAVAGAIVLVVSRTTRSEDERTRRAVDRRLNLLLPAIANED